MDIDLPSVRGSLNVVALFPANEGVMEYAHNDEGVSGELAAAPAPRLLDEDRRICAGSLREVRACYTASTTSTACTPRRAKPASPWPTTSPLPVLARDRSLAKISAQRVELAQHHAGLMR